MIAELVLVRFSANIIVILRKSFSSLSVSFLKSIKSTVIVIPAAAGAICDGTSCCFV